MFFFFFFFCKTKQEEEAKDLVAQAIRSGIDNDLGSGSNIDLCVMKRGDTKFHRNIWKTEIPQKKDYEITYPKGTTCMFCLLFIYCLLFVL